MELADFSKPGEKKKLIVAGGLGLVAILFLWWTFVGFGSTSTPSRPPSTPASTQTSNVGRRTIATPQAPVENTQADDLSNLEPVHPPIILANFADARRNIFAYLEKLVVVATPVPTTTPTPTPTPPVLLASISPANVFAKTADFNLEVTGDRFTSAMRIFVDGREVPTKFKGPQQMSGTVAANIIANPGIRQVIVRTADNAAFSNNIGLNVTPPPIPNFNYVGILGTHQHVDTALLQDKNNKEILSVQRGDVLGGRFRVTSISEKEVVFMDTNLKIRHNLSMTEGERASGSPMARPTPRVDAEDDEP